MRFYILGSTGYIGSAFVEYFKQNNVDYVPLSRSNGTIDYTNHSRLLDYLKEERDIYYNVPGEMCVINCAGYIGKPNVDACESNKSATIAGNVVFPSMLANVTEQLDMPLIHISSGCIYGGYDKEYDETDPPNFTFDTGSFYSGTKALAEQMVTKNCSRYHVFRLRIPFDHQPSPRNYLTKLLSYDRLLEVRNSISHRFDFVNYCYQLFNKAPHGIYNVTNTGSITTKEVVDMLVSYVPEAKNKSFEFFESMDQFGDVTVAPRSNCVLNNDKLKQYIEPRTAQQAVLHAILRYGVQAVRRQLHEQ